MPDSYMCRKQQKDWIESAICGYSDRKWIVDRLVGWFDKTVVALKTYDRPNTGPRRLS